ncbi:MAG: hypothetical protein DHS20C17_31400 [Cyclobacteriaceae bacterium]|nr:MAG: hypothetical protein DHS20C17_31400 [Cyclobacteriaceae bacterium]
MKLLFYDSEIPEFLRNKGNPIGGACVRQYAIARGLVDNGCTVGILTWKGANEYIGQQQINFDLVESFPRNKGIKILRAFYLWMPLLYKAVNRYRPDYLFQKGASPSTLMLGIIAKLSGVRFVYMATSNKDGDERLATVRNRFPRYMFYMGLKFATTIVCQNNYQHDSFVKMFPNKKVILMRNPYLNTSGLDQVKPLEQRSYFAWIGNYRTVKNLPAVYEIAKRMPDYNFKIAGARTFKRDFDLKTKEAVINLEKLSNVDFVGHLKREQIIPFLSNAYALFNTSHLEGFSNTFLEAFAAGTPVITREEIDPDGIIASNNLGKVVQHYPEFQQALLDITNDPNYQEVAANCQRYLQEEHGAKWITGNLLKHLENNHNGKEEKELVI